MCHPPSPPGGHWGIFQVNRAGKDKANGKTLNSNIFEFDIQKQNFDEENSPSVNFNFEFQKLFPFFICLKLFNFKVDLLNLQINFALNYIIT